MTTTYEAALARHDITIPPHLAADAEIPVVCGMQRQGDLLIAPQPAGLVAGLTPVGAGGVQLVAGEASGNTHWLDSADPQRPVSWSTAGTGLGVIVVPDGTHALVTHTDEHGSIAVGPGCYRVVRQRELADEIRTVAD